MNCTSLSVLLEHSRNGSWFTLKLVFEEIVNRFALFAYCIVCSRLLSSLNKLRKCSSDCSSLTLKLVFFKIVNSLAFYAYSNAIILLSIVCFRLLCRFNYRSNVVDSMNSASVITSFIVRNRNSH